MPTTPVAESKQRGGVAGKGAAEAAESTVRDDNNLWFSFLRDSSKRAHSQDCTCVVVGDPDSGKKSLVQQLCFHGREYEMEMNPAQKEIISYNYFDITDVDQQQLEAAARVNMWMFGSHIFHDSYSILSNVCSTDKMLFMIVLDLSRPDDCLPSLLRWLLLVQEFAASYHQQQLSAATSAALRAQLKAYNKFARLHRGDAAKNEAALAPYKVTAATAVATSPMKSPKPTSSSTSSTTTAAAAASSNTSSGAASAEEKDTNNNSSSNSSSNNNNSSSNSDAVAEFAAACFGVPLIVCCCKSDALAAESADDFLRSRQLQARIRAVCLEVGAALVFTSTTAAATSISGSSNSNSSNGSGTAASAAVAAAVSGSNSSFIDSSSSSSSGNIAELKQYLMHRCYPEQISVQLSLIDAVEATFIPAGFDTVDLININSGLQLDCNSFQKEFREKQRQEEQSQRTVAASAADSATTTAATATTDAATSAVAAGDSAVAASDEFKPATDLEDEQDWLKGLQAFIQQVSSTGDDSSSAAGKLSESQNFSGKFTETESATAATAATTATSAAATDGIAATTAAAMAEGSARLPPAGRRVAASPAAAAAATRKSVRDPVEKKDVGDFFKNLLEGKK